MTESDYKQIATDAANIIKGLVRAVQKKGGGHYSSICPTYINTKTGEFGNCLTDAYRFLFDNCGIYWKEYITYLTPEQQEKIKDGGKQ